MAKDQGWVLLRRVSSDLEADIIAGALGDIPVYRDYPGINQMIKIAAGTPQWVELFVPAGALDEAKAILNDAPAPDPPAGTPEAEKPPSPRTPLSRSPGIPLFLIVLLLAFLFVLAFQIEDFF